MLNSLPNILTVSRILAIPAICAAFYLIGREIGWLRPLIGLGPRSDRAAITPAAAERGAVL